jgi:hypothetical protein
VSHSSCGLRCAYLSLTAVVLAACGTDEPTGPSRLFSGGKPCLRGADRIHFAGVRDTAANRTAFAAALVRVYMSYLRENFGLDLGLISAEVAWLMPISER